MLAFEDRLDIVDQPVVDQHRPQQRLFGVEILRQLDRIGGVVDDTQGNGLVHTARVAQASALGNVARVRKRWAVLWIVGLKSLWAGRDRRQLLKRIMLLCTL